MSKRLRTVIEQTSHQVWPAPVPRPAAGDSLEQAQAWRADVESSSVRTLVLVGTGLSLALLMVATFLFAPAPGHQLAVAMLLVTLIGAVALVAGPGLARRSYERRQHEPAVARRLVREEEEG